MTEDLRKLLAKAAVVAALRREKSAESRTMAAMLRNGVSSKDHAQSFEFAADYADRSARTVEQFLLLVATSASLRERVASRKLIGAEDCDTLSLRYSAGSKLVEAGCSDQLIVGVTGHATYAMVRN